jgi:RNA 3'-terminal phosphate cyclase-like protein
LLKKEVNKYTSLVLIGTAVLLRPGIILGGTLQHDCPTSRSIGYFLEPIVRLAPFAKKPVHLTLKGITTDEHDLSVCFFFILASQYLFKCPQYQADILRTVTLPHLQLFGISDGLELRVITTILVANYALTSCIQR